MSENDAPGCTVVTGAAGWLGRALLEGFSARARVRALVHSQAEAEDVAVRWSGAAPIELVVGDISRSATAQRLLHGVPEGTHVIHAAGVIHPRRVRDFVAVNADGTRHLLHEARRVGIGRFVHVSSNSPLGTNPEPSDRFRADEPYNPYLGYGYSKMLAELAVIDAVEHGLDAVIVRPPWFYGPHQPARQTTFFRMVRRGRFPMIGDGSQQRSMVYVGNLVHGIDRAERVVAARGRAYWIADERPYEMREIVETVGRALLDEGYEVTPQGRGLPPVVGRLAEAADRLLQSVGLYQQQVHVLGEMDKTIACDISRSVEELGYRPTVDLYDGMRSSIAWCRENGLEL